MRLAAIDLGSNAVRLLIKNVFVHNQIVQYQKESLIRVPLRLGEEAFVDGYISDDKKAKLENTLSSFKMLMEAFEAESYLACATSAFREAENGENLVQELSEKTGLEIEIIDGQKEAEILYSLDISQQLRPGQSCIYIDVGGGSTEVSLFDGDDFVESRSFKIGTIRLMYDRVINSEWTDLQEWLTEVANRYKKLYAIGSGGNINKLIKMYGKKKKKRLSYEQILDANEEIGKHTFEERIHLMGLKPDRADVIFPATSIFKNIMLWSGIKKIYVPSIGIADGLINLQYEKSAKKIYE